MPFLTGHMGCKGVGFKLPAATRNGMMIWHILLAHVPITCVEIRTHYLLPGPYLECTFVAALFDLFVL